MKRHDDNRFILLQGFDNMYCVSIEDNKGGGGGVSDAWWTATCTVYIIQRTGVWSSFGSKRALRIDTSCINSTSPMLTNALAHGIVRLSLRFLSIIGNSECFECTWFKLMYSLCLVFFNFSFFRRIWNNENFVISRSYLKQLTIGK